MSENILITEKNYSIFWLFPNNLMKWIQFGNIHRYFLKNMKYIILQFKMKWFVKKFICPAQLFPR